ncbi:MAG: NAD(P)/FAD-dependent oxidoreductase [Pseudobdellovibrionaceae bacterium]
MRIRHPAQEAGRSLVVIVGGGFGGLNAAKTLSHHKDVFVILIDQKNHHLFQPLLYQVATAGLNPGDIAVPIRAQFSNVENIEVHWGKVDKVDLQQRVISYSEGELEFDYLILACGAQHSYFAHPEWEKFAPGLKTLEQATEIRRRILSAFERAENEMDPVRQQALLNFIVVGGGPTGVEMAGAIADIARTVIVNDFKRIDPALAQVTLIEAGDRVLSTFSKDLSEKTKEDLQNLGVQVRTSSRVEKINEEGVWVAGQFMPSETVIWAAGVRAAPMTLEPAVQRDSAGRIQVNTDLTVPGFSNCFVIGDMAAVPWTHERIVPGLAPAAIQEGKHAAQMILNSLHHFPRKEFCYLDKGQMATIGKNKAVLQAGAIQMSGLFAWLAWLFIHIFYLIGFRNRFSVMLQWAWNYLFSKRGTRLITERNWELGKSED